MSIDPIDVPDPVNILQRIENEHDLADNQKDRIKAVKTELWFLGVLFRVQRDMTLKSFLTYAEDLFRKDYYIIGGSKDPRKFEHDTSEVLATIQSFKWRNIEKFFHVKISGSSPQSHELVMEVINNVVQNLDNLLIVRLGKPPVVSMYFEVKALIELVKEELRALKNFVCFMEKFSSELKSRWQKFLCHVEVLAIHTACICFLNLPEPQDSKSVAPKFTNLVSDLLEKRIKPIEPGVRKIYTGILKNVLSSSTPPMFSIEPATGFIETLLHISTKLREVFPLNIDTTEILPEQQLNTLTVIVNELPLINNIQDSMRIRFFKRVENLVIHAGLVVYSLCNIRRNNGERKRDLLLLAEKIQRVKTEIYRDIREEVQSLLPKNDTLGFFDFLIGSLKELLYSHYDSLASLKYQLEVVYEELESLETSLKGIAARGIDKREELQDFTARLINKAYEVEYIIGSFVMTEIPHTYLKIWLSDIIKEIKLIKTELTELEEKKEEKTASPAAGKDQLVGFGEVRETIKGRLLGGSRNLDVIPIIGMPGIGKTTLAQSFKDDKEIVSHFSFRGECRVSQVYTRRYLLFSILSDANDERTYRSEEDDSELAARLKKVLFRKGRYLLIIDDVWQTNAWDDLSTCFPDTEGSRIILTTRHQIVASYAKCFTDPYHLRMLTGEESWSLLQRKIFGEEICPEELKEIGEEIAKKCKGLPLSIVLVGGLLARMEKKEQRWKQMELSLGAKIEDESKDLVQVSYKNLPHKMKPCFLYFGAFLEDREILVSKLTNLWIAEGLIENDKEKALEDIAEEYLEDLVGRNLVIVTKRRYNGKLKACLVHDIVLEFCKGKAEKENFLLWLKRDHDANLPDNFSQKPRQRRLLFYCDRDNLAGWSTSCSHARSVLFREVGDNTFSSMKQASNFFANFKFVRVLDLEYIDVDSFPTDLNHLRYLALRTTKNSVPSSIENLWNLETFIVRRIGGTVLLPDTFWKLARLRHVFISDKAVFKLQGAKEILYGSHSKLENLAVLSTPCFSSAENMEKTVKKTPNLRKLRCVFAKSWGSGKNKNRFPVLHSLSRLESLKLLFSHIPQVGPSTFNLPPRLKKLTLCNFPLPLAEISTIANLRELEVLKLHVVEFENEEWEVRDIEFPQLKFLKLEYIQLKTWGVSEEAFPCLQQLVLHSLFLDQGIPSYFGEMVHLKYIEVKSCNTDVEDSARDIEETQVDTYQNCDFKVSVQS